MIIIIVQGFIWITFAILPSLLFTVSLISCESSRPQRKYVEEGKSDKNSKVNGTVSKTQKSGESKTQTKTKSGDSFQSLKEHKTRKLTDSKSKTKKSGQLRKLTESSSSTKSVTRMPADQRRSSRFERFPPKHPIYTNRSVTSDINGKLSEGLQVEPKLLNWNMLGGIQKVYLTNPSDERRAIKVKCSDNQLYRVSRVFGFVEPGEKVGIDVVRQNGSAKPDKMIFLWTIAEKSDQNASKLFNKVSSYPMVTLPLTVNNPAEH